MVHITKPMALVFSLPLIIPAIALGQNQPRRESLSVQGHSGQATVIRSQGRIYVDVQDLAAITNGSVTFDPGGVGLTLPNCEASERADVDADKAGFSRPFMRAAIEAMGSIREWGGILQATVQAHYPAGTAMTGNTIVAYQERATESVALAAAAASTNSDYRGLELLKNEFNNLKAWTDRFLTGRKSMTAQYMTLTDAPLQDDDQAQKMIRCGQFLSQMFAGRSFQDDPACH